MNRNYFNAKLCKSCETVCPYCGKTEQYQDDALAEDETIEQECGECGKIFLVTASISVTHHCYKKED